MKDQWQVRGAVATDGRLGPRDERVRHRISDEGRRPERYGQQRTERCADPRAEGDEDRTAEGERQTCPPAACGVSVNFGRDMAGRSVRRR